MTIGKNFCYKLWSPWFRWKFSRFLFWPCFFQSMLICYYWQKKF
jgi:hypothetical protein